MRCVAVSRMVVVLIAALGAACSNGNSLSPPDGGPEGGDGGHGGAHNGTGGGAGHAAGSGGHAGGGAGQGGSAGGTAGGAGATASGGGSGTGGLAGTGGSAGSGGSPGTGGVAATGGSPGTGGTAGAGGKGGTGSGTGGTAGGSGGKGGAGGSAVVCNPSTEHLCSGVCVSNSATATCGTRCDACTAPSGGTATCDGTSCGFTCGGATPKQCLAAGICIASTGCCTNSDCPTNAGGQTGTCDTASHACSYACSGSTKPCTINGSTVCIPSTGCCASGDCTGSCMTCDSTSHSCVAAKSMDDPNGRCAGTCDASGTCKGKQGQACSTFPNGCITGFCSPDGVCCNTACNGSCVACDFAGATLGTCQNIGRNAAPHVGHSSCNGSNTVCDGFCDGAGACSYPTGSCGSAMCSGTSYTAAGTCSQGSCVTPAAQTCAGNLVCGTNACKSGCTADADCTNGYFCDGGSCHLAAAAAACGDGHTCAVLTDGRVFCWGSNSYGQLGNGTLGQGGPTPVQVTGLPKPAKAVSAGESHTCALLNDGSVWCWGYNVDGEVGNGVYLGAQDTCDGYGNCTGPMGQPTPVQVMGLPGAATAISVGSYHTCALSGGKIYCWGINDSGQLGQTDLSSKATATVVSSLSGVSAIAAGGWYTCAMVGSPTGTIYCWGNNTSGELGDGGYPPSPIVATSVPTMLGAVNSLLSLSAGSHSACALLGSSSLYCWGSNFYGQLGRGTDGVNPGAFGVLASGSFAATLAKVGSENSCVLTKNGSVLCWGLNEYGGCGTGTASPNTAPNIDAPGAAVVLPLSATDVAMGSVAPQSCAILKNGSVWCWGPNGTGALGNNTAQTFSATPVQVLGW
jgi:alpha-tubulin suppressor-like RCC1 family protein